MTSRRRTAQSRRRLEPYCSERGVRGGGGVDAVIGDWPGGIVASYVKEADCRGAGRVRAILFSISRASNIDRT